MKKTKRRYRSRTDWQGWEDQLLQNKYRTTRKPELARLLDRSVGDVKARAQFLGVAGVRRPMTEEEIQTLARLQSEGVGVSDIARQLDRRVGTISNYSRDPSLKAKCAAAMSQLPVPAVEEPVAFALEAPAVEERLEAVVVNADIFDLPLRIYQEMGRQSDLLARIHSALCETNRPRR